MKTARPGDSKAAWTGSRTGGRSFKRWFFGLLLLFGLIGAVVNRSKIEQFADLARHAKPFWLGVAVVFQLGTYFAVAATWHAPLRRMDARLSLASMVPLAIAKLFSDQALPSGGFGGNAFLIMALNHRGVSKPVCMATLLVSIISSYAAGLFAAALTVVLLWFFRQLEPWILIVAAIFAVVMVMVPSVALWLQRHGTTTLPSGLRRILGRGEFLEALSEAPRPLVGDLALLRITTMWQIAVILLDAATLWITLMAVGIHASFLVR